ncbi:MAG: hypothetical protein U9Q73_00375 [Nanoarchaeota archaeon]|nr:hypothetical protein [Nanoarchaeota archaeon]
MEAKIQNGEAGYSHVTKHLEKEGYTFIATWEINQNRYRVLKTNKTTFLIMFKREFFYNFSRYFREQGAKGMGETINISDLKDSVVKGARSVLFIYPNGHIYSISISDFLSNGFRRMNKEGKETISVSIHLLKRENNPPIPEQQEGFKN